MPQTHKKGGARWDGFIKIPNGFLYSFFLVRWDRALGWSGGELGFIFDSRSTKLLVDA